MDGHKRQRNPALLFWGATGIIALSAYVNVVSPDSLTAITVFFVLFTATVWFLAAYLLRRRREALLLAAGISLYLMLRYLGLKQPLYAILLVASIIALEYLWKEKP